MTPFTFFCANVVFLGYLTFLSWIISHDRIWSGSERLTLSFKGYVYVQWGEPDLTPLTKLNLYFEYLWTETNNDTIYGIMSLGKLNQFILNDSLWPVFDN